METGMPEAVSKSNQEIANEIQKSVELYFLALTFTIAGLAIQSAKFSGDRWQWYLKIAGWVCLVIAAIVALERMLRVHTFFRYAHEENKERKRIAQIEQVPAGTVIEFEDIGR